MLSQSAHPWGSPIWPHFSQPHSWMSPISFLGCFPYVLQTTASGGPHHLLVVRLFDSLSKEETITMFCPKAPTRPTWEGWLGWCPFGGQLLLDLQMKAPGHATDLNQNNINKNRIIEFILNTKAN